MVGATLTKDEDLALLTPKAANLTRLAGLVDVPPFTVIQRDGAEVRLPSGPVDRYLVRGCMSGEDTPTSSRAGRSPTVGPVRSQVVSRALARVFADSGVIEVVVQAFLGGPSGVVFCPDDSEALVEYAAVPGGVTAGRVNPFAAVLPNGIGRYRALSLAVFRIFRTFGPCDVEFVGFDPPHFVQVRPITAPFEHDRELSRLKEQLQELSEGAWEQTGYCVDLMERPACDDALLSLFLGTVPRVYEELFGMVPRLSERPFLEIGRQFFAADTLRVALRLAPWRGFRVGLRYPRLMQEIRRELASETVISPQRLMRASILLNLLEETFARWIPSRAREILALRERCRERLMDTCDAGSRAPDLTFSRRLAPRIERDDVRLAWTRLALQEAEGVVVVPGDFRAGPFFVYAGDPEAVPDGSVLLTEELYPEIGDLLGRVKAVVSEGGAHGSHVAILAREQRVPLLIQAAGATRLAAWRQAR